MFAASDRDRRPRGLRNPEEAGAAATDYLRLFGLTALAYLWTRMAEISLAKRAFDDPDGFYAAKVATARAYMQRLLPQTSALLGHHGRRVNDGVRGSGVLNNALAGARTAAAAERQGQEPRR
ncbi:protein of unknown function (plasmid) [Methylocella tundrae]|uniref:Acetyl-CoA dehydrogenase-like C-terminal domain-containing protein n=1 Tax=Methylocella tundrae TaxID=227605 RepID=A0A4U8Z6Y8_METTU|nr:acyl-CoA dehydrogenase C-terminal domain-containing protein [Methylocella tundrae]VFU16545.1 protein of unknown function [Methylocella tundrae]